MTESESETQIISAVRAASDRARYSLYIVTVATIMIFVASHNIHKGGWPVTRLERWYQLIKQTSASPAPRTPLGKSDPGELRLLREEYMKQFVARALFTSSPLPGVSIDVNDLGVFGGITLVLLMIIVAASFATEHESIYLALDLVTSRVVDGPSERGETLLRANLLYHLLATTQVLNVPPTRARWRRAAALAWFRVVFLAPVAVYAWLIWTEWSTRHIRSAYGVNVFPTLWFEVVLFGVLCALSVTTWLHSRAIASRWVEAFYKLNCDLRSAKQMTLAEWLRLGR
jgi:hypothetical protein